VTYCSFEYGTTTAYGKTVPCAFTNAAGKGCAFGSTKPECNFPTGEVGVAVFARAYSLKPLTTYHFRLAAKHEGLPGYGGDLTFATPARSVYGSEPGSGVASSIAHSSSLSTAQMNALLRALAPSPRKATTLALLAKHGFKEKLTAPEAGTAVIDWYYQPPSPKGHKSKRKPVLVASGKLTFKAAGTGTIVVRATAAGRRLLRESNSVKLTLTLTFAPTGAAAAKASTSISLKR
jgi:hypothetical protein